MKKVKPKNEHEEENLPFSFLKKDIDNEKIKAHWQRIKEKIKLGMPLSEGNKEDNQL